MLHVGLPVIPSWNVDQRLNFSFDCRSRSCLATQIQLGNAECSFSHESKPHHFICIRGFQKPTYQHITITGQNLGKWLTRNICIGFGVWCMVLSIQIHQYRSQDPPFIGIWYVDGWVIGCWEGGATQGSKVKTQLNPSLEPFDLYHQSHHPLPCVEGRLIVAY